MKNNKSPGMDGISSEFLKVFWGKLKFLVTNALNSCFQKGKLSTTLRQCIITLLPKGNKDRSQLKNWRPISLLCVVYKLASGAIAERLKQTLDTTISKTQTGFIPGRHLSDSTRFIYDIIQIANNNKSSGLLMLIDFEKAFDSISWRFLYKTLTLFGYSDSFLNWIKLFNNDIKTYVTQCGILSNPIIIGRGCRQGDPIAPYLFLLGAEVLSLLIKTNPNIIGFIINGYEFKLTQFADDTTLILDGTQHSLQSALNTIEIFGNLSGLRMNKEKTKVIWIGKKRLSKDKLNVTECLDWGKAEFKLLGIEFSTDIDAMPEINYSKALEKIKIDIRKWQTRPLTPLGKITVIKSLLLSKLINLFTTLPTTHSFLENINKIFFQFLWNMKPDKIKRNSLYMNYLDGGLKMVNIYDFVKSLKLTWVKKILFETDSQWCKLLMTVCVNILNMNNLLMMGGEWYNIVSNKIKNQFWLETFENWKFFHRNLSISSNYDITQMCLWYNFHITKELLYFLKWLKKGIYLVGDLLDSKGQFISFESLKEMYKFNPSILEYYRIKAIVKTFVETNKTEQFLPYSRPPLPLHL